MRHCPPLSLAMLGVKLFRNRHRYQTMLKSGDWFRDLLVLTLLLGSFFGFKLGERALWSPDEGRYSEITREMVVTGDYITPRLDGIKFFEKPPLFYWLQSASIKAFGLNEWSLRLWPAMFALLGCLAVYAGGRKLFGRRTALLASVDRKSTRLNSSHITISYAVFCLKKKTRTHTRGKCRRNASAA